MFANQLAENFAALRGAMTSTFKFEKPTELIRTIGTQHVDVEAVI